MNTIINETRNRTRKYKVHQFKVGERKGTLSLPLAYPDKVQLAYGKNFLVQEGFSISLASKLQKQMRQYLYNRLTEMGLPDEYVLIMDFAKQPVVGSNSYCDFAVTFPNAFGEDYKLNEAFCRELIKRFEECLN